MLCRSSETLLPANAKPSLVVIERLEMAKVATAAARRCHTDLF